MEGTTKSALLLDQIKSHAHPILIDSMDEIGTRIIEIPGGFTTVSLPQDVGVIKTFKTRLVKLCQKSKLDEYTRLGGTGKIPTPGKEKVSERLDIIWS